MAESQSDGKVWEAYAAKVSKKQDEGAVWDDVRFVCLDCETTGLDPKKDRLVSIGALDVMGGELILEHSFEMLVHVAYNTSAVTVHGITREESQEGGVSEVDALDAFLGYLGGGVIVGHHIRHDIETLSVATERHYGGRLGNYWIDTMDLALAIEDAGGLGGEKMQGYSLDALCERFGVIPHDRHTASGDAFLTAQIFLRLAKLAQKCGMRVFGQVAQESC